MRSSIAKNEREKRRRPSSGEMYVLVHNRSTQMRKKNEYKELLRAKTVTSVHRKIEHSFGCLLPLWGSLIEVVPAHPSHNGYHVFQISADRYGCH